MEIKKEVIARYVSGAQAEFTVLRDAIRDKGIKRFGRPIGMGLVMMFCSHFYVYEPSKSALSRVSAELDATLATAQYADDYKDLRARIDGLYTRFPRTKDPEEWLLNEIREALRQEGLVADSISSPQTESGVGYKIVSRAVALSVEYRQIGAWIARLERNKSLLHVAEMTLVKKRQPIGSNRVTVTISTIVPEGRE